MLTGYAATSENTLEGKNTEPVGYEPVYWNDFTLWDTATNYSWCGQK